MRNVIKRNLALGEFQRLGIPAIDQRDRMGDGFHPLLDGAQILHQIGGGPHDPIGHIVQPQHQRDRHRHRANTGQTVKPQPHRPTRDRDNQHPIQRRQHNVHFGHNTHFGHKGLARVFDSIFAISQFLFVMGEQFDRMNVGIGIHHAARHL